MLGWIREISPAIYWTMALHGLLLLISGAGLVVDSREVLGINPWIKPLKFSISILIYLATLAWLLRDLQLGRAGEVIGWGVAVAMVVENSLIALQAFRGVSSHFNGSTPLNQAIFGVMGLFIAFNTLLMVWLLVLAWQPHRDLTSGYLAGIRWGLMLFLAGSLQAGMMLRILAHTVGLPDGGPGLPLVNWSTKAGDLRIGHFVALHGLQALPVAGWLLDRAGVVAAPVAVGVLALGMATLFVLVTLQALAGKPLIF